MSALAASAVTVNGTWKGEGTSSRLFLFKDVTLVLTGQGGLTNSIAASLFGLTTIVGVRDVRDSNSLLIQAGPSYDRSKLVLYKQDFPVQTDYVVTGANGAANITVTGLATTDQIVSVEDIGGASAYVVAVQKTLSHYTIGSSNTMAQAAGAGDTSAKKLLVRTVVPAYVAYGTPTDVTATVRLTVFGND